MFLDGTCREDEHSLIAQYCQSLSRGDGVIPRSPIQIVAAIDAEQSEQLEAVIRALEEENASLQAEYERLRHKSQSSGHTMTPSEELKFDPSMNGTPPATNGSQIHKPNFYPSMDSNENNILAEARLLRQHKTRLESRMQILEDHNRQLEAQLQRLRQLLDEPKPNSPSKTGTLQSKSVVAAELAMDSPLPQRANGHGHKEGAASMQTFCLIAANCILQHQIEFHTNLIFMLKVNGKLLLQRRHSRKNDLLHQRLVTMRPQPVLKNSFPVSGNIFCCSIISVPLL